MVNAFHSFLRRSCAPLVMTVALAACTPGGLVPSERIDGNTHVGAIQPMGETLPVMPPEPVDQAMPDAAMSDASMSGEGMSGEGMSGEAMSQPMTSEPVRDEPMSGAPARRLPMIDSDEAAALQQSEPSSGTLRIPDEGVSMDAELGVAPSAGQPVRGLAEEQALDIAEGRSAQPVVDGIGSDSPMQMAQPRSEPEPEQLQEPELLPQSSMQDELQQMEPPGPQSRLRAPQSSPEQIALLPRANSPMSTLEDSSVMPASERSCRAELRRMGVSFTDLAPISNGRTCGVPYPIKLSGLSGRIGVKPAVTLNCQVSLAFAKWVKNELNPSARARYLSGIKTVIPLGGYSCRRMNSSSRNPWSEHARGNAIDVGKFVLNSGKQIDVRRKGFFAFREKGLLKAVRSESCKYFSTVLGPGSDPQHKDHFHFDMRMRKSGYRHCD